MKKLKIGIIGCGTIGSALARILLRDFKNEAVLNCLCDANPAKAESLARKIKAGAEICSIGTLIKKSDLIIESAHASVSAGIARKAMAANKQVLVLSVGGLIDPRGRLISLPTRKGKLWIPSGAVAAIDGVLAAREGGIHRATLVTRKPPAGLKNAPYFINKTFPPLAGLREYRVFRGSAQQAVKAFPQNVNVAAVLSLAGIGARRTRVEIWTSSRYRLNEHEMILEGKFGKFRCFIQNLPSLDNPKTSALAIFSSAALLRKIFSPIHIGT